MRSGYDLKGWKCNTNTVFYRLIAQFFKGRVKDAATSVFWHEVLLYV